MKIVALSSYGSEHLIIMLKELAVRGIKLDAVILDNEVREHNRQIQEERTKGYFLWPDFMDIEEYQVPVYFVRDHNGVLSQALLKELKPDVLINAGTPRKLEQHILDIPTRGVVSVHPGKLPDYRGSMAPEWAILKGDPVIMTCYFMTKFYDEGPIICTKRLEITKGDIWQKVRAKVLYATAQLMAEGLREVEVRDLRIDNLPPLPPGGELYKRMPDKDMEVVKEKLKDGTYDPQ